MSSSVLSRLAVALADRYRVSRELGAGGMATVFLAHDLRHERDVAIKVLHPELAAALGGERFLSEIKTTARLQHPHILPLLDSGDVDGLLYYVMPYIAGETLRARLERERQLPIDDALRITREVADALGAAHAVGIIHRDIKPENILLQGGHALVADFGIALAVQSAGGQRMTQTGLSLGTPQYMSPEQAMGERTIDARSDIYALAAVTYEMLTGDPPFTGSSVQAVVSRILTEEPRALTAQRKAVTDAINAAVLKGLEKLPADRFATPAEFVAALQQTTGSMARARGAGATGGRGAWIATAAVIGVLGLGGGWLIGRRSPASGQTADRGSRTALLLSPEHPINGSLTSVVVGVSRDGREILFQGATSQTDPTPRLYRQRLDADSAEAVPNSEWLSNPHLSHDGAWLAAANPEGALVVIPARGGTANLRPVMPGPWSYIAWSPNGTLLLTRGDFRTVQRFDPVTRAVKTLFRVAEPGVWIEDVLPDGKHALVVVAGIVSSSGRSAVLDLASGTLTPLLDDGYASLRYSAGYLLARKMDGTLVAFPFDATRRSITGEARLVTTGIATIGTNGLSQFDASASGVAVFAELPAPQLVEVDRTGQRTTLVEARDQWHAPRYAPDGSSVLADRTTRDGRDVWIVNRTQRTAVRATTAHGGHDAMWTPDGQAFVFLSDESGPMGLRRARPGAPSLADSLFTGRVAGAPVTWLDRGATLVIAGVQDARGDFDLLRVANGGIGPVSTLVGGPGNQQAGAVSPDGRWLAYSTDESGRDEVVVRLADGSGDVVPVSQTGGSEPVWSRDGRELFYRGLTERGVYLMAARVRTDATFRIEARSPLFSVDNFVPASPHSNYDVAPGGQRFVFPEGGAITRVVLLQNVAALFPTMPPAK